MDIFLAILFILICVLLIGMVLLQKGRGGGLAGAFGGAGGHSAFGSRTGDMFTWITVVLVGLFLVVATLTVRFYRPRAIAQGTPAPTADQEPGETDGEAAPVDAPAPAAPTEVPTVPVEIPAAPVEAPEAVEVPAAPTEVPEAPTEVPEAPVEVPEAPVEAPAAPEVPVAE